MDFSKVRELNAKLITHGICIHPYYLRYLPKKYKLAFSYDKCLREIQSQLDKFEHLCKLNRMKNMFREIITIAGFIDSNRNAYSEDMLKLARESISMCATGNLVKGKFELNFELNYEMWEEIYTGTFNDFSAFKAFIVDKGKPDTALAWIRLLYKLQIEKFTKRVYSSIIEYDTKHDYEIPDEVTTDFNKLFWIDGEVKYHNIRCGKAFDAGVRAWYMEQRYKVLPAFQPFVKVFEQAFMDLWEDKFETVYLSLVPCVEAVIRKWAKAIGVQEFWKLYSSINSLKHESKSGETYYKEIYKENKKRGTKSLADELGHEISNDTGLSSKDFYITFMQWCRNKMEDMIYNEHDIKFQTYLNLYNFVGHELLSDNGFFGHFNIRDGYGRNAALHLLSGVSIREGESHISRVMRLTKDVMRVIHLLDCISELMLLADRESISIVRKTVWCKETHISPEKELNVFYRRVVYAYKKFSMKTGFESTSYHTKNYKNFSLEYANFRIPRPIILAEYSNMMLPVNNLFKDEVARESVDGRLDIIKQMRKFLAYSSHYVSETHYDELYSWKEYEELLLKLGKDDVYIGREQLEFEKAIKHRWLLLNEECSNIVHCKKDDPDGVRVKRDVRKCHKYNNFVNCTGQSL